MTIRKPRVTRSPESTSHARAEACANIALAKYWGKSARGNNLTAVPSLSMTLDALRTRTEISFDPDLDRDAVTLNGAQLAGPEADRVTELLDRLRREADRNERARVTSLNDFPTAAGLASSASGFAALAVAASAALDLKLSPGRLSSVARQSSASAGRSLFPGFAQLLADTEEAEPVAPVGHADLAMLVLVTRGEKKPMSSTLGMNHTKSTSPYYAAWVEGAPAIFQRAKCALLACDFAGLADAMEHSTRLMHATMFTSVPPVLYLRGATIELMHEISARRKQGYPEAYTMDAGPNVKLLTLASHLDRARHHYAAFDGVSDIFTCHPGPGAGRLSDSGPLETAPRTEDIS